jgi:DNA-binding NarL/FixJ family response regulator
MQEIEDKKVCVLIVDDADSVRKGLGIALETFDDVVIVGEAANGQEAVELCGQVHPDVVLMDLIMPVMDGVTATRLIHEKFANIKVLVLTSTIDMDSVDAAMREGASAFLLKNISLDKLITTIHSVYQG